MWLFGAAPSLCCVTRVRIDIDRAERRAIGSTEESKHNCQAESVRIRNDFAGGVGRILTDSDGFGGDNLDPSRVFSSEAAGRVPLAEIVGAVKGALDALDVGRLDIARETLTRMLRSLDVSGEREGRRKE